MSITKKHLRFLAILILPFCFTGCTEKQTDNANESYTYWAGNAPGKDIKVIHGKYWQSASLSKEYIVFLELTVSTNWKEEFIKQNKLVLTNNNSDIPSDAPVWFKPKEPKIWKQQVGGESRYFEDAKTGNWYIYEQQL